MPQAEVNAVLQPLLERLLPLYENNELPKESEDFWAARAVKTFCKNGTYDRGIFSIYFFNLVHLEKGEGIYQAAGLPHAQTTRATRTSSKYSPARRPVRRLTCRRSRASS